MADPAPCTKVIKQLLGLQSGDAQQKWFLQSTITQRTWFKNYGMFLEIDLSFDPVGTQVKLQ